MAAWDSHGVVVARVSTGIIHRPETGSSIGGHGIGTMMSDDWELFPNLNVALEAEANYRTCERCFVPAFTSTRE